MSFVLFLLSSRSRLSSVSDVFDFNASPNDDAPLPPMKFPFCGFVQIGNKKNLLTVVICMFLLSSLPRSSWVIVAFILSTSFNAVAPVSLMLLSVFL